VQLNNQIKIISIMPLLLLLGIGLYSSYITYNPSSPDIMQQSMRFYASVALLLLVVTLLIVSYFVIRELNSNTLNFQEILENSILDNEELYDASGLNVSQEIDLKTTKGIKNAYKLIETLIENAKEDKQRALEANASKSLFLANMSHEIRTPLNGIVGFTELLKSTDIDDEQKEFINIIEKSSENLLSIINNILDLSKIESNKTELDMVIFDPIVEFENAIETYGIRASEKNIELNFFLDPAIDKKLLGDAGKIKEILINLLSNAVKFTDLGGKINVEIKKLSTIDNQTELSFSIEDNGVGMTKEQQLNVFNAFTQADVSITRKYGGTGLGLTISTKFLELMGSELKLESEKEKGTRFFFNLILEEVLEGTELSSIQEIKSKKICKFDYELPVQQDIYLDKYFKYYEVETSAFNNMADLKKCNEDNELMGIWIDVDSSDDAFLKNIHKLNPNKVILLSSFSNRTRLEKLNLNVAKILYKPLTPTKIIQGLNSTSLEEPTETKVDVSNSAPFKNIQFHGNILVAEDNFINQKLVKQVLLRYGVNVELANNGLEAFEKRKSSNYDLIFMDIQMPVMDGIEATQEIINYEIEEKLPHIPIIALTANALNGDKERFLEEGLDEYIPKPIETNELLYILKKFLKTKEEEEQTDIITPNSVENKQSSKVEQKKSTPQESGLISILEEEEESFEEPSTPKEEKKILILKKNPLEAQILSKVITNLNYDIEIIPHANQLESYIEDEQYDILLIDQEIEAFNQKVLEKQHKNMNVILLSLAKNSNNHYNKKLIKEVHTGIIKRDKIEQLIKKYRNQK
jgi:signal transduction histidine kinase/CheY-like chemotaxis protein